jgi:hypothetical protein
MEIHAGRLNDYTGGDINSERAMELAYQNWEKSFTIEERPIIKTFKVSKTVSDPEFDTSTKFFQAESLTEVWEHYGSIIPHTYVLNGKIITAHRTLNGKGYGHWEANPYFHWEQDMELATSASFPLIGFCDVTISQLEVTTL